MTGTWGVIGATLVGQGSTSTPPFWLEGPNSGYTSVTSGGTAHTKGSWTEIIASTSAAVDLIVLQAHSNASATDTATLLDIGIGAAASEVVLVPDIPCGGSYTGSSIVWSVAIPVTIASGTRVALRVQGVRTSTASQFKLVLYSGGPVVGSTTAVSLGTSTSTSTGVEVGTGWTEVVASTAAAYDALVICPALTTTTSGAANSDLIIGTGAASSEVEVARLPFSTSAIEYISSPSGMYGWNLGSLIAGVPAGTRIVAKSATACDVGFIGIS